MKRFLQALLLPLVALALPKQGNVTGGSAEMAAQDAELHITTGALRTAIEWDEFSIAKGEAVRFFQQSADSAVLNNVTGGSISNLMGTLESKLGKVYIINPNGIIIGKDALIDTGSLIASTLKMANEDFFQGKDHFAGDAKATVVNLGTLRASNGDIHVISYQIDNQGKMEAPNGHVTLSAAKEAWLQPKENKRVLIKATLGEATEDDGITNTGTIQALQTELDADGSVYRFAINHSGTINATSLESENGRVFLRAENGCAKVTGTIAAPGGHVEVLAERVGIDDEALIDVSHEMEGGAILIGGDWRGENTPFRADHTYLGPRAVLRSDGLGHGSGGRVVLWGNLSSRVFGGVSACGGALGGDGGKIEISRVPLLGSSRIYTDAPQGKTGTLLIDPVDITITTANTTTDVTVTGTDPATYAYSGTATTINIKNTDLEGLLGTNNVLVDATITVTNPGEGSITLGAVSGSDDPIITWVGSNSLTLTAAAEGTLQVNQGVSAGGAINLNARNIYFGQIDHSHTNAINFSATSGTVTITGTSASSGGILGVYGGAASSCALNVDSLTVTQSGGYPLDIEVTTSSNSSSSAAINIPNTGSVTANDITITANGGSANLGAVDGVMSISAAGDISINVANTSTAGSAILQGSALTITNYGSIAVECDAGSGTPSASISALSTLTIGSTSSTGSKNITVTSNQGDAFVSGASGVVITNATGGPGNISITSDGANAGNAYITSDLGGNVTIGSTTDPMGELTLSTLNGSNGGAYISSDSGAVSIYGTRVATGVAKSVSVQDSSLPVPRSLDPTPGANDANIQASGNIIFDIGLNSSVTSGGRTIIYSTGGNVTIGASGSTNDTPLISLSGSQELIIETAATGTLQFYDGVEQTGTGAITLTAQNIYVGDTNGQLNTIDVSTNSGDIAIESNGATPGTFGIYGGDSKNARVYSSTGAISVEGSTPFGNVTVQSDGSDSGDAYISGGSVVIGNSTPIDTLTLSTLNGSAGNAYIESTNGAVSIAGTRTGAIQTSTASTTIPSPIVHDLAYTPVDGDVYIQASGTLTLALENLTSVSSTGNTYFVAGTGITYGTQDQGDSAMWALNTAQNLVFEVGSSGTLLFNEGLTNSGIGTLTLKGGDITLGRSAGASNEIIVKPTGALTVDFIYDNSTLTIYGSSNGGNSCALTSVGDVTVQEASGLSGGAIALVGNTGKAYFGTNFPSDFSQSMSVTLNSGSSSSTSISLTDNADMMANTMTLTVPGAIEISGQNGSTAIATATGDLDIYCGGDITVTASGSNDVYIYSQGSLTLGSTESPVGSITVQSTSDGSAYLQANDFSIVSGAITVENQAAGTALVIGSETGASSIDATGAIQVINSGSGDYALIEAVGQMTIGTSGAISVSAEGAGAAYINFYGNGEITQVTNGITVSSSGAGTASIQSLDGADLKIGWTSPTTVGDIAITGSAGGQASINSANDLSINGSGDITITGSGTSSIGIQASGVMTLGSTASGYSRLGTITLQAENSGAAFVFGEATVSIVSGAINLSNAGSDTNFGASIYSGGETMTIASSGAISVSTSSSGVAYIDFDQGGEITQATGGITVSSSGAGNAYIQSDNSDNLNIGWTSPTTVGDIAITASSEGDAYISSANDLSINGTGAITIIGSAGGSASLESAGAMTLGSTASGYSRMGAISLSSTAGAGDVYIQSAGDLAITSGAITLLRSGGSGTVEITALTTSDVDIASSGSISVTDAQIIGGTVSQFTSGGTITNNGGTIETRSGNLTILADQNVLLQGSARIKADTVNLQSIVIACDQVSEEPGIYHIDISDDTVITAGLNNTGKLQIFSGYFEHNTISTAAGILNGGTFSGKDSVADAHNIYEVVYDAGTLPSLDYTAPYTFYYEDVTTVTTEIEQAAILLGATMMSSSSLSQYSALTQLERLRQGYIDRGLPFKFVNSDKKKKQHHLEKQEDEAEKSGAESQESNGESEESSAESQESSSESQESRSE